MIPAKVFENFCQEFSKILVPTPTVPRNRKGHEGRPPGGGNRPTVMFNPSPL